jgi:hypothetical protein
MCIKNAEFDSDFKSVENNAKNLMRKQLSTKKLQKNGVFFTFITVAKSFLSELLCHYFQWIRTRPRILRFMVPLSDLKKLFLLKLALFAKPKSKSEESAQKTKNIFYKCSRKNRNQLKFATCLSQLNHFNASLLKIWQKLKHKDDF